MKETLISFLENVAKGMYGTTKLTHDDVTNFWECAKQFEIEEITDYYWEWHSSLASNAAEMTELEDFIFSTIKSYN
jgi:hypothetical protein